MAGEKEGRSSVERVQDVLTQFHNSGVVNLDKSVRDMLAPTQALAQLTPGSEVAAAVIAWDGYALVIASAVSKPEELARVADQLRQTTGG